MKNLAGILGTFIVASTSFTPIILNTNECTFELETDLIINTSKYNLAHDFTEGGTEIDFVQTYRFSYEDDEYIKPTDFRYTSRKGDGSAYIQLAGNIDLIDFNPYSLLSFNKLKKIDNEYEPTPSEIMRDFCGKSEKIRVKQGGQYWAELSIYTSLYWSYFGGSYTFIFALLAHIEQNMLSPNYAQVRGSFGEMVNFYQDRLS